LQLKSHDVTPVTNAAAWNEYYRSLTDAYLFPNEFVVRIFLASYPDLKMERRYKGANIGDISCADGRNMVLLNKLGGQLYGVEISDEICAITRKKLLEHSDHIKADIRTGTNDHLPFDDAFFDYLLSWNACYYMRDEKADFATHVAEFARVMKPGAYFVACVPAPTCFSLQNAQKLENNLIRIQSASKWSMLTGSIYRAFHSPADIESAFGTHFENFSHASLTDNCFGLALDYFIFVCQKR
jgi:SAM-dependent methyltransferase